MNALPGGELIEKGLADQEGFETAPIALSASPTKLLSRFSGEPNATSESSRKSR
jgi:hypothetical protein